ncbi:MAG: transketolase [Synergistota bacterium]|nr:transketolase [Synergistota bacterium]
MEITRINELEQIASEVRKDIVRMVGVARSGPLEFPLLISDVLVYLYWEEMLLLAQNPKRNDRDRFILGTEDGVPALYSILARRGYYGREELWHYRRLGAMLQTLPDFRRTPGIDAPCVTSGTELAIAAPLAQSLSIEGLNARVFCLLEESECGCEEFFLEAERCAKKNIKNIIVIAAYKHRDVSDPNDLQVKCSDRLSGYGWRILKMDGSDFASMEEIFGILDAEGSDPTAIFTSIRNGKGLSFAESGHTGTKKGLSIEAMDRALEELEGKSNG